MFMNREIEFKDNKVIVTDENWNKTERELSSNIKEILISENDIEKMEQMITDEMSDIKASKKKIRNKSVYHFSLASLWGMGTVLRIIIKDEIVLTSLYGLNAFLHISIGCSYIIPEAKYIKISKKKIDFIKKKIEEEKDNLRKLEENKDTSSNYIDTSNTSLSTSEKIDKLNDYLYVIKNYNLNKRKYIKHFKKGNLKEYASNYYDDEFELLEQLIKNDIGYSKYSPANIKEEQDEKQKVIKK